jgi:hypothetical protein
VRCCAGELEEALTASSARTQELEGTEVSLQNCKAAAATAAADTAAAHAAEIEDLKKSHTAAMQKMIDKALDIEVLHFSIRPCFA